MNSKSICNQCKGYINHEKKFEEIEGKKYEVCFYRKILFPEQLCLLETPENIEKGRYVKWCSNFFSIDKTEKEEEEYIKSIEGR